MRRAIVLALVLGACRRNSDEISVGSARFELDAAWQRTDTQSRGSVTAVFTPSRNLRKESIAVIRTEVGSVATIYTPEVLTQLLAGAQRSLPDGHPGLMKAVASSEGLQGVQIEVDFRPPGTNQRYRRVHAVFADGTALIHIVYTAATPEPGLPTYLRVLDTIHEES